MSVKYCIGRILAYLLDQVSVPVASWSDARTACKNDGGNLVSISDIHESGFVVTLAGQSSPFWIGLSDERVCMLVIYSVTHFFRIYRQHK